MTEYNELRAKAATHDNKGGGVFIEDPANVELIIWQTRPAPISDYEAALAQTLMDVYATGVTELDDVVAGLNAKGSLTPDGKSWNAENFQANMKTLGDVMDQ